MKQKRRKFPFLFDRNIKITVQFNFQIQEVKTKDVLAGIWFAFGLAF